MSRQPLIVEGTWQEVAEIGVRYADRRVRLIVLPPTESVSELQNRPLEATRNGETTEPHLIDEGGVLVLASLNGEVEDWNALVEREREARANDLDYFGKSVV